MRKFVLASICSSFIILQASAQVEWNVFGGPQITSSRYVIRDKTQDNKIKYGFQLGAGLKVPFESRIFFVPQVFYSMKGYNVTFNQFAYPPDTNALNNDTRLHTVEIAAMLQIDLNDKPGHLFLRAGPSIDVQLYGHESYDRSVGAHVSRKMKFSFADYGHFGANLLLHFGYETAGGFSIYAQYTHGFGSIVNTDSGPRVFHRAAGITVGYTIKKSKIVIDTRNKE